MARTPICPTSSTPPMPMQLPEEHASAPCSSGVFSPSPSSAGKGPLCALLLRLYAPVAMLIGLGSLATFCLFWYPFAMLVGWLPLPGTVRRWLGRRVMFVCMRLYMVILQVLCFVRLDVRALKALQPERSMVIIANHPSLIDAVLFIAHLPNTVCVMKAALQGSVLFGAATRLAHYVSNASPLHMIREAVQELEHGAHVVIFPESTRTTQWPVNPCSGASAIMAQRSGLPLQEMFIEMSSPYLGKHWPLFKPPVLPLHIRIVPGKQLDPAGQTPNAVAAQFEADVRAHFAPPAPEMPRCHD